MRKLNYQLYNLEKTKNKGIPQITLESRMKYKSQHGINKQKIMEKIFCAHIGNYTQMINRNVTGSMFLFDQTMTRVEGNILDQINKKQNVPISMVMNLNGVIVTKSFFHSFFLSFCTYFFSGSFCLFT